MGNVIKVNFGKEEPVFAGGLAPLNKPVAELRLILAASKLSPHEKDEIIRLIQEIVTIVGCEAGGFNGNNIE